MLLSLRQNGLDSLFKEVRVLKFFPGDFEGAKPLENYEK